MIREETEFRIACYADGTLPASDRAALEAELAGDGKLRALLEEYQKLQSVLEMAGRSSLPGVRWHQLTGELSRAVAESAVSFTGDSAAVALSQLSEEVEYSIACFADGSLAEDRREDVEKLLATDSRARSLLEQYQNVDATVKAVAYRLALPSVQWDRLAAYLSRETAAGAMATIPEELERQISEYAAHALPQGEQVAVEASLSAQPAARLILSEYQNLEAALKHLPIADPGSAVNWDRFAARISAEVDRASEATPLQAAPKRRASTRDSYPIFSWLRSPMRLATAASILLALGVGVRLLQHGSPTTPVVPPVVVQPGSIEVASLTVEKAAGPAVEDISIGPPTQSARGPGGDDLAVDTGDSDGIVSQPPRAFVASGRPVSTDAEMLPAMPF